MMAVFEYPARRREIEGMSRFEYTIENVLDIPLWEKMQDRLAELTGTAIVCIDIKGKPVTKHSGRTAFCSIVRENPVSRKRCFRCDALAGVEAVRRGRPYIYLCHCGIVDVAVPVMVGDIYLGAVMFGQVRLRHKDRKRRSVW
jgi:ligand-binding sensor protein